VFWSIFFFLLTLAVYWLSNAQLGDRLIPRDSPYVHHVNQANALLHGRLDIDPQYAKNPNLLERALEDELLDDVKRGITPPPCGEVKCYLTHPPMPAILLMPFVAIWGLDVNQTVISVLLGAVTAVLVYLVTRKMTDRVAVQALYTVLFMFGTIFWYTAANGGVWFFSHTAAVMFLFLAIYAALVPRNALLAGSGLGAAFLSRNDSAWAVIFLLIMFSDQSLRWTGDRPLWKRVELKPLLLIAAGALPFVLFSFWFNYARFEDVFDSGYTHSEQVYQPQLAYIYEGYELFDVSYVQRHVPVIFESMPVFKNDPPYIIPYGFAMAIWATTPAFLYALFAGVRNKWLIAGLGLGLAAATLATLWTAASRGWDLGPFDAELTGSWLFIPNWWKFVPFWAGIAVGIGAAVWLAVRERELLAIACWATIVPIALTNFVFAATGWTQFGYRYALELYPFLFLLTMKGMGAELKWHHMLVTAMSVVVNLWAILWIYQFGPARTFGWQWFEFF
jgi:hypothetical protein